MKAVRTNELEAGMFAAMAMDLPNCGGIQITRQGIIERIQPSDMWGSASDTLQTLWFNEDGETKVITVNNSHLWLVRENNF